jgi:hypothetical protein
MRVPSECSRLKVFALRDQLVRDYRDCAESLLTIEDDRIRQGVAREPDDGQLWPGPPLQLNPAFERGGYIDDLVRRGVLEEELGVALRQGIGRWSLQ